ncbi:MAG: alpha/beta hydrolase [Coriobacteriales bacterium]|jgi:hypothetical protein
MARTRSRRSLVARIGIIVIAVVILGGTAFALYAADFYHADEAALEALSPDDDDGVLVQEMDDGSIAFSPADPKAGLIFYPGGKVQAEAYAPLLRECAGRGITCVLTKPLCNLAILDRNMADGIAEQFPDIDTWIIGGHSLGGVVAAMYADGHPGEFDGIVFLAAYPSVDLSDFDGSALTVYGSNDGVLNREKYEKSKDNFPAETRTIEIAGGNHSGFGCYGDQKGDGAATISPEEQQSQTVNAIAELASAA